MMSDSNHAETTPALTCSSCENPIRPGQSRVPSPTGTKHQLCELHDDLRDAFKFFITNPASTPGVAISMYVQNGDTEFPVLTTTGTLTSFSSASPKVGADDAIRPTKHFFPTIAHTHHWLMCLMNGVDRDEINEQIEIFYPNGKAPAHERWAIHYIVSHFHPPGEIIPEFRDLHRFVDAHTDWGLPEVME